MKGCSKMEMELQLSMNAEQTKIVIKNTKKIYGQGEEDVNELHVILQL